MDKKLIKGILIVVLLAGLYFLNIQQQKEYENTEIQFLNVEKSLIKKIIISSANDAIELTAIDSSWVISGNDSLIIKPNVVDNLLSKLYDIKKEHKVTSKEEKWGIYKVDPPSGTHLAFIGDGGNTLAYYVFGQASEYTKCYVRTDQNKEVYLLNSNIMFQLRTDPNFWGEIPKTEIIVPDTTVSE